MPLKQNMEDWQFEFEWARVQNFVRTTMRRETPPDLNTVLFLIGIQELGRWKRNFTKEEKQDLMHIGVCRLLSTEGFYEFVGRDEDGWPHFRQVLEMHPESATEQEKRLKHYAIEYFKATELAEDAD